MNSRNLIIYKWEHKVYDLQDMVKLVQDSVITKDDFFDITRYNYDGVTDNIICKIRKIML